MSRIPRSGHRAALTSQAKKGKIMMAACAHHARNASPLIAGRRGLGVRIWAGYAALAPLDLCKRRGDVLYRKGVRDMYRHALWLRELGLSDSAEPICAPRRGRVGAV